MVKRRALWPVGVVWASVLVLSGCVDGGGPAVESSPPVMTSESVETSPSPSMSDEERLLAMIPEEAKGDDLMAAEAMAKFFITLRPGIFQGGDAALFEHLCLPESVFCSSTLATVNERNHDGVLRIGGDVSLSSRPGISVLDTETDNTTTALIQFEFTEDAFRDVDAEGVDTQVSEGGDYSASLALRQVDGVWRIYGVEVVRR